MARLVAAIDCMHIGAYGHAMHNMLNTNFECTLIKIIHILNCVFHASKLVIDNLSEEAVHTCPGTSSFCMYLNAKSCQIVRSSYGTNHALAYPWIARRNVTGYGEKADTYRVHPV